MGSLRALEERAAEVMLGPERPFTERAGGAVGMSKIAVLALALILGGCAPKVARRERPPVFAPSTGSQWAHVLAPNSTTFADATRRNESLNVRTSRAALATDAWPSTPKPSLRYSRRIYLPTTDRSYIYYDTSYTLGSSGYRRR